MNYLSHFYVHQNQQGPHYHTGLILPDLARGFAKNLGKVSYNSFSFSELAQGCRMHHEADKVFHGSTFFKEGSEICIDAIKQARFETDVKRRWFIGHVMFEMLIDRILVNHIPAVADDFYRNLNLLSDSELKEFIDLHPNQEPERFIRIFNHFRSAQYLRNYPDNNLFCYSLSRVLQRAGLASVSPSDRLIMQDCVLKLENGEFRNSQQVIFELKEIFS